MAPVPTRRPQPAKAVAVLLKLTNREIARQTGRSEQYVSRVLNGYVPPSPAFASDLATVLGADDAMSLFDWDDLVPDNHGLEQWVAQSRAAQGLPPKVTDPATLRLIARMIGASEGGEPNAAA